MVLLFGNGYSDGKNLSNARGHGSVAGEQWFYRFSGGEYGNSVTDLYYKAIL